MWSGIIDQFRFYNRAINESEVKEIFFDDSPSTVSDGLVGYWTFENSLNDISGKNKGNLDSIITSMAFTPDGRLFFDEKNTGKIRIMKDDRVLSAPFAVLSDYHANWEQGLLGLTIDPKFEQNHFVYMYYTAIDNKTGQAQIFNRLVRFTENNNQAANMIVLIDKIPASRGYHSGGALTFGPDDKLYIGVGDATQHIFAQDGEIFTGKVLRINRDGTIPQDNPFPNSSVYTLGHRNIFGLAFDKKDGIGIITENGDFHYDEINLIQKGGNYGFPSLQSPNIAPELFTNNSSIKPLRSYWQTIAPTQAIYYDGDKVPELKNKFLFGTFTGNIYALTVDKSSKVIEEEKIALRHYPFEPVVSIAQSPSGDIYFGGYHIYKLQSVDMSSKTQDLFPIEIKSLSNVAIEDLQSSNNDGGIAVNIHISTNKNGSSSSTRPFLQMNIPSALIPEISSVTTTIINGEKQLSTKPVDSTTTSSPSYNTIGIHFQPEIDYSQLLINGMSPKHNVPNATSIQSNPSDISSVSIVKYATDTSTAMPYNPSPLTVEKGTVVTWTNNDFATHTVTEVTNKFDSGILAPAQVFKHTFDEPGAVKYYCTLHPFMSGEVIVKSISHYNSLSPIIIHQGNNSNKRIAFVENTFTYAAYRNGSFYDFYKKYIPIAREPSIVFNITSDLNLLKNRPIPHGPFPYYAHPRQPPDIPYIEYFKILLKHVKKNDPLITNITDADVHEGKIFRTNGSNAYDILFLFHNEYVTQTEYNNLRQFVSNGGTIVFTEANTLFAEVSYNKANDTITLVKGHEWKFDGKSARRSIGERWLAENREWTGSNFLDIPSTFKISYKNNPFNYTNGEEQYVTNPHAKILLDYGASFSSDKYPNATVATYQMDYGKGKIINLGIWGHELINNEAFLNYFDNVIMPIAVGSTDKNIITK
jgi:glucose/arabinose dehydrogenase/plastocyanin